MVHAFHRRRLRRKGNVINMVIIWTINLIIWKILSPFMNSDQSLAACILSFSVPSRDCRNANVCLSVCHKRFLVWTEWIKGWIQGYNELTGEFRGIMNKWVNSGVQWINGWILGYNELVFKGKCQSKLVENPFPHWLQLIETYAQGFIEELNFV